MAFEFVFYYIQILDRINCKKMFKRLFLNYYHNLLYYIRILYTF